MPLRAPADITGGLYGPYRIYPEFLGPSKIPLTLVCGSPGSGKSTYVFNHARGSDLVLCLDAIKTEIAGVGEHSLDETLVAPALRVRNERLVRLSRNPPWRAAWLIVGEPRSERRDWWRSKLLPCSVVVIETPLGECLRRIAADESRRGMEARMSELATSWWADYTRSPLDEVVRDVQPPGARSAQRSRFGFW